MKQWKMLLADWDRKWENDDDDTKEMRIRRKIYNQLVRTFLPDPLRAKAWQMLANCRVPEELVDAYEDFHSRADSIPEEVKENIEVDLRRVFPTHVRFSSGELIPVLSEIMRTYAYYKPNIGYNQPMSMLVGTMLIEGLEPAEAFWLLKVFLERDIFLKGYFSVGMPQVIDDTRIFQQLVNDRLPDLGEHMRRVGVEWQVVVPMWFPSLFTTVLPWGTVRRVWDMFCLEGAIVLFRTGLTVMAMLKDPLMERDDATEIYILLSRVPKHLLCIDAFMPTYFGFRGIAQIVARLHTNLNATRLSEIVAAKFCDPIEGVERLPGESLFTANAAIDWVQANTDAKNRAEAIATCTDWWHSGVFRSNETFHYRPLADDDTLYFFPLDRKLAFITSRMLEPAYGFAFETKTTRDGTDCPHAFTGSALVEWVMKVLELQNTNTAVALVRQLFKRGEFVPLEEDGRVLLKSHFVMRMDLDPSGSVSSAGASSTGASQ